MTVQTVCVGVLGTNCYLVSDDRTKDAVLIDPAYEVEKIERSIGDNRILAVILTHGHFDHISSADYFRAKYGCPIVAAEAEKAYFTDYLLYSAGGLVSEKRFVPLMVDRFVKDGETLTFGSLSFDVRVLSGHTAGDLCLHAEGKLFCGDLLFYHSVGRTDFPGGDPEKLGISLRELLQYPDDTVVYPGHDRPTTIGQERKENMYIQYLNINGKEI